MHFRFSNGEINSFKDFFTKGMRTHLKVVAVLLLGFGLLRLIRFIYATTLASERTGDILESGYCFFALMFYLSYVYVSYRREKYTSFLVKDDMIYERFKDKEMGAIKLTSLVCFKEMTVENKINFLVFYKDEKYTKVKSFGLLDLNIARDLEKYLLSKGIEKWAFGRIL